MNKNFALIGAAGYIAIRHMKAIKETNNKLVAALDRFDSVGIIDSFFPSTHFFTEPERFDRHIYKLKQSKNAINYVSICSPNYLHDAHIRLALRNGADAICEKPLVLNPWNIDALEQVEKDYDKKINNILQLRLHPSIIALKNKVDNGPKNKIYDVDLSYLTSRGNWYFTSWKGDITKSGGIATNIGIHFFDMLTWIFGKVKINQCHLSKEDRASGFLELERARVRWFLSINYDLIPKNIKEIGQRTFRSITVEGDEIEFSGGFTDLHTKSYKAIIDGNGFGLKEAKTSINIVHNIRNSEPIGLKGDYHPFCKL
ncbi:MAG: oxidoreductase [Flavobacteriales bacterium]|nr:oxidoreductase [Flavobacteriales bacterium]|tara:strand:- start:8167 stop:9108 length:942 start_codon:yes stop_codon:yes gene_type:complete